MSDTQKREDLKFRHKVRPRYHKALIPALIISLIIAVILILIVYKYLFKPAFEEKGSSHPNTSLLVERIAPPMWNLEVNKIL